MNIIVSAANFSSTDASKLTSLLQSDDSDEDSEHGAGTLDVLEKLEEKAKAMLENDEKKEEKSQYEYDMLKDALRQDIYLAERELETMKKRKAEDSQTKADAEGDLSVTSTDLEND